MNFVEAWNPFWKRVFAGMGGGGVRLALQLHADSAARDGEVTGVLLLQGGVVAQRVESLVVRLKELQGQGENSQWKTLSEAVVATSIDIAPGEMQRHVFRLRVPANAKISPNGNSAQVTAKANVRWAISRNRLAAIRITPVAEIMALHTALKQLGFQSKQYNFVAARASNGNFVTNAYHAPHTLSAQITSATFQLSLENNCVYGHLMLNHAKTNLKDILRAAIGEGKQLLPIEIPRNLLAGENGIVEARRRLKKLLDQALILPDNEANWMLRASAPPSEVGDTLLRAADVVVETRPEQLLHPLERATPPDM